MLKNGALRALASWCAARSTRWVPAQTDDGRPGLLLERRGRTPAEAVLVVPHQGGYRLVDGAGDVLASASALPALLDALDGGVAETPSFGTSWLTLRSVRPVALAA